MAAWTGNEGERAGNGCVLEAEPVDHAGEKEAGGEIKAKAPTGEFNNRVGGGVFTEMEKT